METSICYVLTFGPSHFRSGSGETPGSNWATQAIRYMEKIRMQDEKKGAEKEAYASPKLVVYGNISTITASNMIAGTDGGTKGINTHST